MIAAVDNARVFIRRPRPTDQGFIASTWADSITNGGRERKGPINVTIDRLLDDPAVRILVASEPADTNVILGWLVYTPLPARLIIHYAYVRGRMRRRGIMTALINKATNGQPKARPIALTMRGPDTEVLAARYRDTIMMSMRDFLGD